MAFSITHYPTEYYSAAYRPIIFKVLNTAPQGSNPRVRADIYVNDIKISSTYRYSDTSPLVYTFDVSEHLKSVLTGKPEDFKKGTGQFASSNESSRTFYCVFTELYEDSNGLLQEGLTATSSTFGVLNATRQHLENQNLLGYTIDGDEQRDFLTNMPNKQFVPADTYLQIAFINNPSITSITITVEQFTSSNSSIQKDYYLLNNSATRRVFQQKMEDLASNCAYIKIAVGSAPDSELYLYTKTVYVDRTVNKQHSTLFFRNSLGGYDQFTFKGKRKNSLSTKTQTFTRPLGNDFELSNRGEIITGIEANESFEIYSEFLSEEKMSWLKELLYSVDVYLYDSETPFVGIEVIQNGDFGNSDGWVAFDSTTDASSDVMEVTTNEGTPSSGGGVSQLLEGLEVGEDYLVSVTHLEGTSTVRSINFTLSAGSLEGVESEVALDEQATTSFIYSPSATSVYLNLRNDGVAGSTNFWDDVSVKRYEIKDKLIPIVIDDGKVITHESEQATQLKLNCRYSNAINTQSNTNDASVILQSS